MMKKLDIEQAEPIRKKYCPSWEIRKGAYLYKKVAFDDYNQALRFFMVIEKPQIKLDHFADIGFFYNEVILMVYTHDVGGLTQLDFELALYIDKALEQMGARQLEENFADGKKTEGAEITMWTNPEYQGADVDDKYYKKQPVKIVDVSKLTPFEPADKMDPKDNHDNMMRFVDKIKAGDKIKPIVIVPHEGKLLIVDGHHRYFAHIKAGADKIRAVIADPKDLTWRDDVPESVKENFAESDVPLGKYLYHVTYASGLLGMLKDGYLNVQGPSGFADYFSMTADPKYVVSGNPEVQIVIDTARVSKMETFEKYVDDWDDSGKEDGDWESEYRVEETIPWNYVVEVRILKSEVTPEIVELAKQRNVKLVGKDTRVTENFADGKKPGRKGLSKRVGIPKGATLAQLEKIAKNSTGERRRMAQWQLNMRRGKNKSK